MKVFNKIAALTLVTTMMLAQVQAIELVEVETVASFSIIEAAQKSLADSMKFETSKITLAKAVINAQIEQINDLEQADKQSFTKSLSVAE
ncbi:MULTISPECIES: hypothetical protein [unclassified Colwellia]|uniref:hypothetical protein n=1 Tax=unclassified Colwellia TaxID=196834 RepID=UPI0015F6B55F|nr:MULTISPECIES: hypothetical protein [unclassified Colwellia]MBA6233028.1 hypothetical protein [Colwellia sp. MB02u-7]MBA6236706.1 hypothetical protein [Colwellia sp. MB02u-11]MBA6255898.1 hypothetical protein [Colwellia sp. MB3u-28]MBA6262040.1 hypothetical protein [Colwellia sp. MB3u-41]MBA6299008.1 hypothetical protein [Colwellia sp. MB3u-22]